MSIEALADYTFTSRYARYIPEKKRRETWDEAVDRSMMMHIRRFPHVREDIEQAFAMVRQKRVLPAMRSMQFGGKPVETKHSRLFNCWNSYADRVRFFQEAFWLLLCGGGVGFSVQTHHIAKLPPFYDFLKHTGTDAGSGGQDKFRRGLRTHVIEDSIEGWGDALGVLIGTYIPHEEFRDWEGYEVIFDFSKIRPEGSTLSNGMGKAPGPAPLQRALEKIRDLLDRCLREGQDRLRPIDAYDIVMHASDAVLAGGVRRSATLCMFSFDDEEMATAKTGNWFITNPQRGRSNNSAVLLRDKTTYEQFHSLIESVREFGEPGFIWTDSTEGGYNPCVEIGLFPVDRQTGQSGWQPCNLTEINGRAIQHEGDFYAAVRAATIIGTLQASYTKLAYLGPVSERIAEQEALLGVSITGYADSPATLLDPFIQRKGAKIAVEVNEEFARKIAIRPAARVTCTKPAGSTSCVLGTASGIHPHHAKRYFRRVQGNKNDPVLQHFKKINPRAVEPSVWSANGTDEVVTFLIESSPDAVTKQDVSAVELLGKVRSTQENWVAGGKVLDRCVEPWLSHNVSNTINVDHDEWDAVAEYIYEHRQSFAGVSLLPDTGDLDYPQAPFMRVLDPREIYAEYKSEYPRAFCLMLDAFDAFGSLWAASDCVLGVGEFVDPDTQYSDPTVAKKLDWMDRCRNYADVHMGGDIKRTTHMLKHVWAWDEWTRLKKSYTEVDYTTLTEEQDNTKFTEEAACAGGACVI